MWQRSACILGRGNMWDVVWAGWRGECTAHGFPQYTLGIVWMPGRPTDLRPGTNCCVMYVCTHGVAVSGARPGALLTYRAAWSDGRNSILGMCRLWVSSAVCQDCPCFWDELCHSVVSGTCTSSLGMGLLMFRHRWMDPGWVGLDRDGGGGLARHALWHSGLTSQVGRHVVARCLLLVSWAVGFWVRSESQTVRNLLVLVQDMCSAAPGCRGPGSGSTPSVALACWVNVLGNRLRVLCYDWAWVLRNIPGLMGYAVTFFLCLYTAASLYFC